MTSPTDVPTPTPIPITNGLTAIRGVAVGHDRLVGRPTGCTVILTKRGAVAGVDIRGGAPGSREIALLDPVCSVEQIHGLVLSGGSAFGLDTASGVLRWLEEHGIGFETHAGRVPIVPASILYDLAVGDRPHLRPDAESGYRAAAVASSAAVEEGNVGAGSGATVGKLFGPKRAMKSGLGSAAVETADGLRVAALFAVNAVGDVVDPHSGRVVAGTRTADGKNFLDLASLLRSGAALPLLGRESATGLNTTLGVVATNASLSKAQATKVAQMAHDGLARTTYPAHTPWDGDTIFALATGERPPLDDLLTLGALAAEVTTEAILRGARQAASLPGLPAAVDFPAAAGGRDR